MLTIRCTQKLLRRVGMLPKVETAPPTTVLGDWYANIVFTRPQQLVLCMNERSLLVVLLPAQNFRNAAPQFQEQVSSLLARIGVSADAVAAEKQAMSEVRFGPTANRSVLGCLNEAAFALSYKLETSSGASAEETEDDFSEVIYSATRYRQPRELALELFAARGAGSGASVLRIQ
jgi:hypothetical protein